MKHFVLVCALLLSGCVLAQNSECERFREGNFSMEIDGHGTIFLFRKKKTQIESGGTDKLKILYRVKWESPCVYTLKVKKVLSNPANLYVDKKVVVRVEILEVREKSYLQRTTVPNSNFESVGEVFVIQ